MLREVKYTITVMNISVFVQLESYKSFLAIFPCILQVNNESFCHV